MIKNITQYIFCGVKMPHLFLLMLLVACSNAPAPEPIKRSASARYRGAMIAPMPHPEHVSHTISLGANILRYQMLIPNERALTMSCDEYRSDINGYLNHFDTIQHLSPNWILDLHTPIGGMTNLRHHIFDRPDLQECIVQLWKDVAIRMHTNSRIVVFELLNEPLGTPAEVSSLMERMRNAVRSVTTKPVMIAPRHHSVEFFNRVKYYRDPNTWYAFHFYFPGKFTHHGIFTPSNRLAKYGSDGKTRMLTYMKQVLDFKKKYPKAKIWVTEFGASIYTEEISRYRWFRDTISIWEANNFNWTFHAIYECPCWSPFHHASVIDLLVNRWNR